MRGIASAWCGAISTRARAGREPARAPRTSCSIASSPVGPLTSASRVRSRRPRGQRGDLVLRDVRRVRQRRAAASAQLVGQRVEPRPCRARRTRGRPQPATFARATASASALTSVAHTSTSGAPPRARARSRPNRCRGRRPSMTCRRRDARDAAPAAATRCPSRTASSSATSTTHSVSGRGISTRASTNRSRPRNAHDPSTYCSGSPRDPPLAPSRRGALGATSARRRRRSPATRRPSYPDACSSEPPRLRLGRRRRPRRRAGARPRGAARATSHESGAHSPPSCR